MKKQALRFVAPCAVLAGCTVIDGHERVPGWPELKVVEHYVSHDEMRARCRPYAPMFTLPEGCTLFHLDDGEAHIYVSKDFPAQWVLEHERLHAAGYDHIGSTSMQRMLEGWKAAKASSAGPLFSNVYEPRIPRVAADPKPLADAATFAP